MFVSRAAKRRLYWAQRRAIERALSRTLQAHFDRLLVNALLYGTSHPEMFIGFDYGDDDVQA